MGVERIMLFKLHDPDTRSEMAALTRAALSPLENIASLSVGLPADAASLKSWDLSVVIGVANLALLAALLEGEPFKHYLEVTMKDRYVVLKAWNFEVVG